MLARMGCPETGGEAAEVSAWCRYFALLLDNCMTHEWTRMHKRREMFDLGISVNIPF